MTREEARRAAEVMLAYADGKKIEYFDEGMGKWLRCVGPQFVCGRKYRIGLQSECRPFKDVEECWQEMLKHQPFGWVKNNGDITVFKNIVSLAEGFVGVAEQDTFDLCEMWEAYTFADGTPFGVKEGEEFLACVKC